MMTTTNAEGQTSAFESAAWCCFYGSGIIGMLLIYGLLQERIMTVEYDGELFTTAVFLVFCNRIVAVMYAIAMIIAKSEPFKPQAPLWKFLAISFSNVGATTCQYEALKFVSFPVQMLGKSFKMMPVMVWGMAISAKTYKPIDWMVALAVTLGVTEFLMTGSIDSPNSSGTSIYGLLYLVAFLALDGFTSTSQELLFKQHKTSKYNQMLYINLGSTCVSVFTLLVSGGFTSALAFCMAHPLLLRDAAMLSGAAVAGQYFIYSQVKESGALVFAATMNVRQVISILISYRTYGHPISMLQPLGLMAVFGALFYKSYLGFVSAENAGKGESLPLNARKDDEEMPTEGSNSQMPEPKVA